ncbi:MAG: TolC family outer membrane protein [Gammaproteobacteria bacterium]|nr:TolC family outer membrane protein [Gammaproteobacteria bacterium]
MRITRSGPLDPTTRRAAARRTPSPWRAAKPLVASAVLALGGTSWGADISEIYAEAIANDPVLARARASYEISRTGVTAARASLLPQVSASASRRTGTTSVDAIDMNPNSPNFGRTRPDTETTSQSWGASVNQQVLNLGSWFGYRGAQADSNRADWDLQTASQLLITRVAQAYLNVLSRQAELESAIAAEEAVQRQLEQVQQRFDVGLEAITGVLESKAAYDSAVVTRIRAESQQRVSFEALRTLTGTAYGEIADLKEDLAIVDPLPNDEEEWVRTAMETNSGIRSAQQALASAEHSVRSNMSQYLPTVSAGASYGTNSGQASVQGIILPDQGTSTSVGYSFNFQMPLFQGMRTQANVKRARLSRDLARHSLIEQELNVAEQVRTRFRLVVTDVVAVAASAEALKSAQAALEATQTGYEVGTRNIVDVLRAQQDVFRSEYQYNLSRHTYVLDMLRLKESAGTLSESDIQELNSNIDAGNPVQKAP